MTQQFVWLELATPEPDRVTEFLAALFDWKPQDAGGMTLFMPDEKMGASLVASGRDGGGGWLPFVGVADIRAATDAAKGLGATIEQDVTETPFGLRSVVKIPPGARLALFQRKE